MVLGITMNYIVEQHFTNDIVMDGGIHNVNVRIGKLVQESTESFLRKT